MIGELAHRLKVGVLRRLIGPRTLHALMEGRARTLAEHVKSATAMRVAAGPFRGMPLLEETAWGTHADLAAKLLGAYEQELWEPIERAVRAKPDVIVNVGCAEGYYAVGLARACPWAEVHAIDVDPRARRICGEASRAAGVGERVRVTDRVSPRELARSARAARRALLVLDCEGAERELLLGDAPEAFRSATLIVECHDFLDRSLSDDLARGFSPTHGVQRVEQGARNPHLHPALRSWPEHDKWIVLSEGRPETMHWLVLEPRG